MKKVTLQDIADSLEISRISVWKVFSGREGVSDELRKKVIKRATELNYNFPKDFELPAGCKKNEQMLNISVVVSHPEASLYWMTIIHEIAKELSFNNANLSYIYLPTTLPEDYKLPSQFYDNSIDGLIILNVYQKELIRLLSKLALPKVYMDSLQAVNFEDLNGDLVLTSGKASISKITQHIIDQQKMNIGFIGNCSFSYTTHELYEGYVETLQRNHLPVCKNNSLLQSCNPISWDQEITHFLQGLDTMPEAFVCASDHIAFVTWRILTSMGYEVPNDVLLSGYDELQGYSMTKNLTTVQLFNQNIGFRLATQILQKIANPTLRHELIHISSEVIFRNSTDLVK